MDFGFGVFLGIEPLSRITTDFLRNEHMLGGV
jgi:hypothetical protein